MSDARSAGRVRPIKALRAIRALIRDPDDTVRVFEVIDALAGQSGARVFARFRRTPGGARLLASRPDLMRTLSDGESLLALPAGTLGCTYGEFMRRESLSADGLAAASMEGGSGRLLDLPEERRWLGARLRDMHDLWHVVTGYNRDLVGEAALLAFSYAQTRNPGVGAIVATAYLRAGGEASWVRRLIREGYLRGRRAAWLPAQPWEELLARPLDELRAELRIDAMSHYQQVRSAGAVRSAA